MATTEPISPMMAIVFQFFADEDIPAQKLEGDDLVRALFTGDNGEWTCFIRVEEEEGQCLFYSSFPTLVPNDKRAAMAEFLTRANHELLMGNFDLDFEDGEVRFKTGIDVMDDQLSLPLFRNVAINNLAMMDQYWPGLMAMLTTDISPADALAQLTQE